MVPPGRRFGPTAAATPVCRSVQPFARLSVFGGPWMIRPYKGRWPKLGDRAYVDVSAQVIGDVELGDHASIWMNAVVRGDVNGIDRKSVV